MSDVHKYYLFDLGYLLREQALDARDAHAAANGTDDADFQSGRLMAYYQVVSLLISQANGFQIPLEELRLEGINPDQDLLC